MMFGKIGKSIGSTASKATLLGGMLLFTVGAAHAFDNLQPLKPQPAADSLKPGLAVQYYGAKIDSIDGSRYQRPD
jgi:hypothetical protein